MSDFGTVLWKEWKELRAQGDTGFSAKTTMFMVVVLLLFIGGLASVGGPVMVHTPIPFLITFPSVLGVMAAICDSFAGERERHTLETILASRIPDEPLLVGKIVAFVLYGWVASVVLLLTFVVGANVRTLEQGFALPPIAVTLGSLFIAPLLILFFAAAGVLFSLKAATVKEAQLRVTLFFFALFIPLSVIANLLPKPNVGQVKEFLSTTSGQLLAVLVNGLLLLALDTAIILVAWGRFRRSRLIVLR